MPKATIPWPPRSGPATTSTKTETNPKPAEPGPAEPTRGPVDKRTLQTIVLQSMPGKPVSIVFTDGTVTNGVLVSSDIYTLLVQRPDGETLYFKHAIRSIRREIPE